MQCSLEQHELRVGRLSVKLQRRLPATPLCQSGAGSAAGDQRRVDATTRDLAADTTGLDLWTPAVRLCVSYLQGNASEYGLQTDGGATHVLELGAGLGAAGLLAAQLGAKGLLLTDGEPHILPLLVHNAALNPLPGSAQVSTARLRYGNDADAAAALHKLPDSARLLVIGSDLLYSTYSAEYIYAINRPNNRGELTDLCEIDSVFPGE